jgi:hypothetical protein
MFTLFMRYGAWAGKPSKKFLCVGECGLCDTKGMVGGIIGGQNGV